MTIQKDKLASAPVLIEELVPESRFSLRVRPEHRTDLAAALSMELPQRIGHRAVFSQGEALCLGPDEWLIKTDEGAALTDAARAVYARLPHSLTEISDREITLRLTGLQVLDLLATGCPRDFEALAEGGGVRTVFDSATIVLWRDGPAEFRMDIWRSFAPHVRSLLAQAETELSAAV